MITNDKLIQIFDKLALLYLEPKPSLDYNNEFDFLVAIILSAQCTDKRVNIITKDLFPKYNTPEKILKLGDQGLQTIIKSCGFYRAKSNNILGMCTMLLDKYRGVMPSTMNELIELPGVGRKTASVLLSQWFKIPAFPVDTHVHRVANRLGLVKTKTPEQTEKVLLKIVPKKYWIDGHLQLIFHGREICDARKPKCEICPLYDLCRFKGK